MRSFHNGSFDPRTLVVLETAFDEAWLTLKSVGNKTVKPDELARYVLRMAMEGERDPVDCTTERLMDCYPRPSGARRADRVAVASTAISGYTRPLSDVKVANASIGVVGVLLSIMLRSVTG